MITCLVTTTMWQCSKNKLLSKKISLYHHLLGWSFHVLFFRSQSAHTHTHKPVLHSKRAPGGPASRHWEKKKRKEAAAEDVRLYLTYSSFEILWCAPSQPSLDSSWLDEKHFYWALWGGQLPLCAYLYVFVGKNVNQQAILVISDETLHLNRVRWKDEEKLITQLCEWSNQPAFTVEPSAYCDAQISP